MKQYKKHAVFVHLLNDYSGSPSVLAQVINALPNDEYEKTLLVSSSSLNGFLSNLNGVNTKLFWYRWKASNWLRLLTYFVSQVHLFFIVLSFRKKEVVIYINTLLPFGAAIAGKIIGKKIIYHIHETTIKPKPLKSFLVFTANSCAAKAIYVSNYLMEVMPLNSIAGEVIYNSLSENFITIANTFNANNTEDDLKEKNVLMICSLKKYKGVDEFYFLAKILPKINFELVLNATSEEVNCYQKKNGNLTNLKVYPSQTNVHSFYQRAAIVLNLSHPTTWVETFGLTILEAMHYGIPVIAPNIGGPKELIDNEINGYLTSVDELEKIKNQLITLLSNSTLYNQFKKSALQKANHFSHFQFKNSILLQFKSQLNY